ncbi:MAG: hypothetical protein K6F72_06275 [Bacteroidales bacterium]|nr:hypothetical protein [Bacteroidales bacterium]
MRRLIATILFVTMAVTAVQAQDKAIMSQHQKRLAALLELATTAPTDNERYLASEQAVGELSAALEEENSERWQWQLPRVASVLTSPDGLLRIFTWAVERDNGEFECFGAIQFYNDREEEYQYLLLNDKSEEIMNREESLLSASNWFGAIYQDIIQTSHSGKTYYTLLGWNGVDNLTERKVIEPVIFRGGLPQFGAPLFRRERNLRRIVLEYRNDAMVNLSYEEQFVEEVQRDRVKVKGTNRYRTVEKRKQHKEKMIIFDEVEPQVPGMEGLFQYYVPSGLELAYAFVDGKWELRNGAQGRLKDKKLNKAFEPLPKTAPAYSPR